MSDRLSEIEARLSAATPGPWAWRNTTEPLLVGARSRIAMAFRRMGTHAAQPQFRDSDGLLVDGGKANLNAFPDAALIAHAPADLAALVKFAREVEARHRPVHPDWVRPGDRVCEECTDAAAYAAGVSFIAWPCPTAVAVQRLGGE